MADGKFDDSRSFNGKKVAIWALLIFFIVSIVGTGGTYLFGEWLSPILSRKNRDEIERNAIKTVEQREEPKKDVR